MDNDPLSEKTKQYLESIIEVVYMEGFGFSAMYNECKVEINEQKEQQHSNKFEYLTNRLQDIKSNAARLMRGSTTSNDNANARATTQTTKTQPTQHHQVTVNRPRLCWGRG